MNITRVRSAKSLLAASCAAACMIGLAAARSEAQAARTPPARAATATPRLADGRPDLNGTWDHDGGISFLKPQKLANGSVCIFGCPPPGGGRGNAGGGPPELPPGEFPKYQPQFLAKIKDLSDRQVQTDTVLQCHAPGVPRIGPPAKIVQSPREVLFLYDDVNGSFFRIVPVDGRPHRKGLSASYLGDAIGRWEGDALVVETTNFNEETWLTDNGAFHSKDLRVVERLRRVGDTIEYQATAYDSAVLAEPWVKMPVVMKLTAQELVESARCEDRDLEHIVDGSHHDNAR
jgi:hypothetical protein